MIENISDYGGRMDEFLMRQDQKQGDLLGGFCNIQLINGKNLNQGSGSMEGWKRKERLKIKLDVNLAGVDK